MATPTLIRFTAGGAGAWRITSIAPVIGETLAPAQRLAMDEAAAPPAPSSPWILRGSTSNHRYTTRAERDDLVARQASVGRASSTRAALIPIRKSDAWWDLAQDERRAIFEESSRHIAVGMKYLPAIARRLAHCRELGEPFDFLTWFEFAANDEAAFDELVAALRSTPEWGYVTREVDVRLSRD